MERTFGWRHFRALQKQGQGKAALVLLQATCDESTQFWVRGRAAPGRPTRRLLLVYRGRSGRGLGCRSAVQQGWLRQQTLRRHWQLQPEPGSWQRGRQRGCTRLLRRTGR